MGTALKSVFLNVARRNMCQLIVTVTVVKMAAVSTMADDGPKFESDVRPILKTHCWQCHGEESELEASLDLRLARFIKSGGDSGSAVSAQDHEGSLIWQRVVSGEMPPGPKRLSAAEIQVIANWIDSGAKTLRPEPESILNEGHFTEEERKHWSFQPIRRPEIPDVEEWQGIKTPVDSFIKSRLEDAEVSFSMVADKETLIRRLSINLRGLPPSPEEIDIFVSDTHPLAYERLVDRWLASPSYGERWGRHWLDAVGYADSDGVTKRDNERAWAFKYRDYVVNAFNSNKPWDEFIIEQLAGDELVPQPYTDLSLDDAQRLIATGFLRMSPDGTSGDVLDQELARNQTIAEVIKVVSTSLLGLSVGCAQCHSHRYDAITHTDYYQIRALFEPGYNWKEWRSPSSRLISQWSAETAALDQSIQQEVAELTSHRDTELDDAAERVVQDKIASLPEDIREAARVARATPEGERTDEQKKLIEDNAFLKVNGRSLQEIDGGAKNQVLEKWDPQIAEANGRRPPRDYLMPLTEVPGTIPVTFRFNRGDHKQPLEEVLPGGLSVLAPDDFEIPLNNAELQTSGRRLAFARYLTSGKHPLVARVIVNRIWMHHFGVGLVATPGDFGTQGELPSHPKLLDWLASEFMQSGWDLKHLHRLILCSRTFQQSAVRTERLQNIDPENRLLGRMSVRRIESEVLRDSLLMLSGQLVNPMFGPAAPVSLDNVGQRVIVSRNQYDPSGRLLRNVEAVGEAAFRRTLYVQVRRSLPLGVLEPFDLPTLNPNCTKRTSSNNSPQSLLMLNDPFVIAQVNGIARRIMVEVGDRSDAQVNRAWQLVIGRLPTEAQRDSALSFLEDIESEIGGVEADAQDTRQKALTQLCQALVASNAFLYVE